MHGELWMNTLGRKRGFDPAEVLHSKTTPHTSKTKKATFPHKPLWYGMLLHHFLCFLNVKILLNRKQRQQNINEQFMFWI